jgi:predicted unusual protein kinase regulating ubiquinone biosynthesis (AarF/ABC1/UbiB family)
VQEQVGPQQAGWRIHARHLPAPTRQELATRGAQISSAFARRLAPVVGHRIRARDGSLSDLSDIARPLRLAYEDLGGTFIKFGQLVASSPGLFGEVLSTEFRSCLDTGPPVPYDQIRVLIEDELGMRIEDAYAWFDPVPIGRASIAVVHRARLHDGRDVAVKVLRPGIERNVATDLALMEPIFELLATKTGDQLAGATVQQLDALRLQIGEELDLRNEARAQSLFARLIADAGFQALVVPEPVMDLSSANVLTMQFLDGVAIDDLRSAEALGIDPAPLVDQLIRAFFTLMVNEGVFHGDVHAGNLILLRDGRLGIIDWGIVGRLDARTHRFVLRMLAAVLGDESAWQDVTAYVVDTYGTPLRDAMGMDDEQLGAFMRAMIEPVLLRPFGEFSFGQLLVDAQARAAEAQGINLRRGGVRGVIRQVRLQRRLRQAAVDGGGLFSESDRANFLLGKQLMYFERYGKLFLADAPILADHEFVAGLLADRAARHPDVA